MTVTDSLIGWAPVTISPTEATYSDSPIGWAAVTIVPTGTVQDSLIGWAPVTIAARPRWRRRQAGVWVRERLHVRQAGAWVPMTERDLAPSTYSDSAIGWAAVTITAPRPAEGSIEPHTGVPIAYYETLHQAGDQVWEALNRATSPCVVSFPAGTFTITDFAARTKTNVTTGGGINLEKNLIHGIIGAGPTQTKFVLAEGSSTKGGTSLTPTQAQGGTTQVFIVRSVDHGGPLTLRNFGVQGTAQGHNFHGIQIENVAGAVLIENVHVAGWCGDNGAPPGETSGLAVKVNSAAPLTIRRVVADGRYPSGTVAGTVGIHVMHALSPLIEDCETINHRVSAAMVAYHTVGATFRRCHMASDTSIAGTGWPFNAECNTGLTLEECTFGATTTKLLHATFSNTTHSRTFNGTVYSLANGTMLVKGGTWGASGIGGAGTKFAIQSWTSGIDGSNTDTQTTPPKVVNSAGIGQNYRWVHDGHYDIQSPNL